VAISNLGQAYHSNAPVAGHLSWVNPNNGKKYLTKTRRLYLGDNRRVKTRAQVWWMMEAQEEKELQGWEERGKSL